MISSLRQAVGFLTILPVAPSDPSTGAIAGPAIWWFVPVGLVRGAIVAFVWWPLATVLPPSVAAAAVPLGFAVISGALHLDGLADSADAALAPVDSERRRAILKDPRTGVFAVVAVTGLLLLGYAAATGLTPPSGVTAIVLAGGSGALAMVAGLTLLPAAPIGLGRDLAAAASPANCGLSAAGLIIVALLLAGPWGVVCIAFASVAGLGTSWFVARRIGRASGDGFGAGCEVAQVGGLLAFALMASLQPG